MGQAISVAKAWRNRDEAEAALGQYPEVMSEIRGDEDETLDSLQENLKAAKVQIQEAEEQIEEAEETIEQSRIPEDGLPEGRVEGLKTKATNLREQERAVRERRADLKEAEKKEEEAWGRLPTGRDKEAAAAIDLPELEEVETHAKAVQDFQGRREAFKTAEELFSGASPTRLQIRSETGYGNSTGGFSDPTRTVGMSLRSRNGSSLSAVFSSRWLGERCCLRDRETRRSWEGS